MAATRSVKIGYDAVDIKDALRRHHPGEREDSFVGRWTCIEEWAGIDLLALDAWADAAVIGYEVKISRGDMRNELLEPAKRAMAVRRCTQFYFAVPAGLLQPEEIAFEEPDWDLADFDREPCPGIEYDFGQNDPTKRGHRRASQRVGGRCRNPRHAQSWGRKRPRSSRARPFDDLPKGFLVRLPVPVVVKPLSARYVDGEPVYSDWDIEHALERQGWRLVTCPTCRGTGYARRSRVELEAPTLWVPKDVGLVEIDGRGVTIVKRAPKNKTPEPLLPEPSSNLSDEHANRSRRHALNDFARWVSNRPDPRH